MLSAVVKQNSKGEWHIPQESPLAWLQTHYRAEVPPLGTPVTWPAPELRVDLLSEVPPPPSWERVTPDLETPLPFTPEAAPYQITLPSQLAEAEIRAEIAALEDPDTPRLRGEIIHRGLETLAQGGELPGVAGLTAALRQAGLGAGAGRSPGPGASIGVGGLSPRPLAGAPA